MAYGSNATPDTDASRFQLPNTPAGRKAGKAKGKPKPRPKGKARPKGKRA